MAKMSKNAAALAAHERARILSATGFSCHLRRAGLTPAIELHFDTLAEARAAAAELIASGKAVGRRPAIYAHTPANGVEFVADSFEY